MATYRQDRSIKNPLTLSTMCKQQRVTVRPSFAFLCFLQTADNAGRIAPDNSVGFY